MRAKAGEPGALDELLRRVLPEVRAIVSSDRDGTRIVGDVGVVVMNKLGEFSDPPDSTTSKFRHWVTKIAQNMLRWSRAKRRPGRGVGEERAVSAELANRAAPGPTLSAELAAKELGEQMLRLIDELDEAYREPIRRRLIDGEPEDRVAAELGIQVNTLRVRITRGRSKLLDRLVQAGLIER